MKRSILAAAVTLSLAACGGTTPGGGLGQSNGCSVTLSGAQTGTYDCHSAFAIWDATKNQGGFTFSVSAGGTTPQITVAIEFTGEPHSGTISNTDTGASGGLTVYLSSGGSGTYWAALTDTSNSQGSYSLKFSGVSTTYSTTSGKTYNTDGTLDATMPAVSGTSATGTVTLHATF